MVRIPLSPTIELFQKRKEKELGHVYTRQNFVREFGQLCVIVSTLYIGGLNI